MPRNNRYSYYDDDKSNNDDESETKVEESTEESTATESSNESTEESNQDQESVNEIVVIDPETFGVSVSETDESKTDNRPIIDEAKFVYHPEDGSVTHKLDEDGCPQGYFWNELKGRCSPNSEKEE